MNPPLKWTGGKRWLVSTVERFLGPDVLDDLERGDRRLVEPFCGGCAITFALEPKFAILNDANPHLINFYKHWQRGPLPFHLLHTDYFWNRERFNATAVSASEMAALFYYLNHAAFNSIWRVNSHGEFNVPRRPGFTNDRLPALQPYIGHRYRFVHGDFALLAFEPTDVIFADPPYDDGFTGYTRDRFTWDDQERLAVLLAGHPGPVMLTNKATPRILALYHQLGYQLMILNSKQAMQRSQGRTDDVLEVLATLAPRVTLDQEGR